MFVNICASIMNCSVWLVAVLPFSVKLTSAVSMVGQPASYLDSADHGKDSLRKELWR